MATTELITMTDDLDPMISEGVQTVSFFDPETGEKVELELGEKNARALNKAIAGLEKYLAVARVVQAPKPVKAAAKTGNKGELAKIREWAQGNGYKVGDRGRIKGDIVDAYYAAQQAIATPDTDAQASGDEPVTALTDTENVQMVEVDNTETAPVESEQSNENRPATEAELQEMLLKMAVNGTEPTIADLSISE